MLLTNVLGAALTIRAAYDALVETRGHLLLTSSVAGRCALPGSLDSVTKQAVTAMGESACQEFNGTGVRVTLIEPGMVDTPFFDKPPPMERTGGRRDRRAVLYAVQQPPHVDVNEPLIRPTAQPPRRPRAPATVTVRSPIPSPASRRRRRAREAPRGARWRAAAQQPRWTSSPRSAASARDPPRRRWNAAAVVHASPASPG